MKLLEFYLLCCLGDGSAFSKSSLIKLEMCFKKGFKRISKNILSLCVSHAGQSTIRRMLRSFVAHLFIQEL